MLKYFHCCNCFCLWKTAKAFHHCMGKSKRDNMASKRISGYVTLFTQHQWTYKSSFWYSRRTSLSSWTIFHASVFRVYSLFHYLLIISLRFHILRRNVFIVIWAEIITDPAPSIDCKQPLQATSHRFFQVISFCIFLRIALDLRGIYCKLVFTFILNIQVDDILAGGVFIHSFMFRTLTLRPFN